MVLLNVRSLPPDEEVLRSIPGSVLGFFSSGELFNDVYGSGFSGFQCPIFVFRPVLSPEKAPALCCL